MKAVVACLVATVALLALRAPSVAAPPDDVAAYCRATYPQVQFQVRCLNIENAAAERVSRAGAGADREAFNRCLGASPSWAAMEGCLAQSARGVPIAGVPGVLSGPPADASGQAARPEAPTGSGPGAPATATATTPDVAGTPPGSSVILGPQAGAPAVIEDRPTRPISEADADRYLRSVLEHSGTSATRCTKKQYGPGWVIICE
jgi:hypothetical protein